MWILIHLPRFVLLLLCWYYLSFHGCNIFFYHRVVFFLFFAWAGCVGFNEGGAPAVGVQGTPLVIDVRPSCGAVVYDVHWAAMVMRENLSSSFFLLVFVLRWWQLVLPASRGGLVRWRCYLRLQLGLRALPLSAALGLGMTPNPFPCLRVTDPRSPTSNPNLIKIIKTEHKWCRKNGSVSCNLQCCC